MSGSKACLMARGATEPANGKDRFGSHWHIGDQAYLLRVTPRPEEINDESRYEFFAANFSSNTTPTLKPIPPGSRYGMNLHEFRLGNRDAGGRR